MSTTLRIGTRKSPLALWQAEHIKDLLERRHPGLAVELVKIMTKGDKILDVSLSQVGGKGLFVKEIEEALLDGRIDLAVHSMKDVPTDLEQGLILAATTEREDPRDAVIARDAVPFKEFPVGSRIGTASLRRQAQLLHLRPDFVMLPIRGNVGTRINKLVDDNLAAVILAYAGLKRLGLADRVTEILEPSVSLPAIGQGALGIETRDDDARVNDLIAFLDHPATAHAVAAERSFLRKLEGGCQVPIACFGTIQGSDLTVEGRVVSLDGKVMIADRITGAPEDGVAMGLELAERLLAEGAGEILREVYGRP
jgi:hydroxymethylbilane synthase